MDKSFEEFKRLIDEIPQDHPMAGSIELLLRQMDPQGARQLQLCAIPHHFNPEILQALDSQLDYHTAGQRCSEFAELSIVIGRQQSYFLHDEVRHYLFNKWLQSDHSREFASASLRLVEYFGRYLKTVSGEALEDCERSHMFHLLGVDQNQGFQEFERLIRQRRHQFLYDECETLIKLVNEYKDILAASLTDKLTYHEAKLAADLRQWKRAEQHFKSLLDKTGLDPRLRIKAYNRLGLIKAELREWKSAIELFQEGLQSAKALEDSADLVYRNLHDLAAAYRDNGNLTAANQLLNESIHLAENFEDTAALALSYNSLGILYSKIGHLHQAVDSYKKTLDYLERGEDRFRAAQVYNNLGVAYLDLEDWKKSEQYFQKSLTIKRKAGDTLGQAMSLNNLVQVYQHRKQYQKGAEASRQAIEKFTEMNDNHNVALAERTMARFYRSMKQKEPARHAYEKAIVLFNDFNEPKEAAATHRELKGLSRRRPVVRWVLISAAALLLLMIIAVIGLLIFLRQSQEQVTLGDQLREQGKFQQAIEAYQRAIEMNSENYIAYNNRGFTYMMLNRMQEALTDFSKAIKINPEDYIPYINRGITYRNLNRLQHAVADFDNAIKINSQAIEAYHERSSTFFDLQQYDRAIADLTRATEVNPRHDASYFSRGFIFWHLKQDQMAVEDYTRAIEINSQNHIYFNNRGLTYLYLQKYDKALEDLTRAIELLPDSATSYNHRGKAYYHLKKYDHALNDYSSAIANYPKYAMAFGNRGWIYHLRGNLLEAKKDYHQQLALETEKTSYAPVLLGILAWQENQSEEARRFFKQALTLAPKDELNPYYRNYMHRMAVSRLGVGDTQTGLEIYRRLAQEAPDYQIRDAVLALKLLLESPKQINGVRQAVELLEAAASH